MFANEGLYTSLTWSQVTIGLIVGFVGVYLATATERLRRGFATGAQPMLQDEVKASREHEDVPRLVVGIVRAAYYALAMLAKSNEPVPLGSLVRRIQSLQKNQSDQKPLRLLAIQTAMERLITQRHIRLGRRGLEITGSGKKLLNRLARINERPTSERG